MAGGRAMYKREIIPSMCTFYSPKLFALEDLIPVGLINNFFLRFGGDLRF